MNKHSVFNYSGGSDILNTSFFPPFFWSLFGVTLIIVAEMRDHGKSNPRLCCIRFNKAWNYVDNIDGLIERLPQFRIL